MKLAITHFRVLLLSPPTTEPIFLKLELTGKSTKQLV